MSTYHRFGTNDILHSLVHAAPRVVMASGTTGWRGNVGPSSSLSLYGGLRGRTDVKSSDFQTTGISVVPLDLLDTHSIDKVVFVSGSYPATGSVQFVKVRNVPYPSTLGGFQAVTSTDWYDEHFRPIEQLFRFYSRKNSDYFIGTYDHRSLYLKQNIQYQAPCVTFSGSSLSTISSSFTLQLRIKPTALTGSSRFTLQSQRNKWAFYITGSTGRLAFSDFATVLTSSANLSLGSWQTVGFKADGTTAKFFIDQSVVDSFPYTGSMGASTASLVLGAQHVVSGTALVYDNGYTGFLYESRVWKVALTDAQMSSSAFTAFSSPYPAALAHYARLNDGDLSTLHGFSMGSGAFDYSSGSQHGSFQNVRQVLPLGPIWQPNDDSEFVVEKTVSQGTPTFLRVLHVPSLFYGRQIATGSVNLVCRAYNRQGIIRRLVDDGRGSLYLSGSLTRTMSGEDFGGVKWNRVGSVFYSEGLVVITDPSLLDFATRDGDWDGTGDLLEVEFTGVQRIQTKVFTCRLPVATANASNNPSFSKVDPTDQLSERLVVARPEPVTYVTAIGLYDEERNLVAVAKLAQPIRKREKDKENIKLRIDI